MDTNLLFQACLGHRKRARHPNMRPFLLPRSALSLDLIRPEDFLDSLARAKTRLDTLRKQAASILWVGDHKTRQALRQAQHNTKIAYLAERWPGGLLTNHEQVCHSPRGTIAHLERRPNLLVIVRPAQTAQIALREARACGIETIGIIDSNSDPSCVDWPIYANDDSAVVLKELICRLI